jgi:hypothetical protein
MPSGGFRGNSPVFSSSSAPGIRGISDVRDLLISGNIPRVAFLAQYVVVAGGGGGSTAFKPGGGGGGGFRSSLTGLNSGSSSGAVESSLTVTMGQDYTVTIGAGSPSNSKGSNSIFASITSEGGGSNSSGGSGAGGNYEQGGYAGTAGQGYNGAAAFVSGHGDWYGGGGGGARGAGGNSSPGAGATTDLITGSSVTYSAGGAGSGAGGGAGATNTGTGGKNGNSGGSGIVMIKIPEDYTASFSAGIVSSGGGASGGFRVYTVTSGTGTVTFS